MDSLSAVLGLLPDKPKKALDKCEKSTKNQISEIRIRAEHPITLSLYGMKRMRLDCVMSMDDVNECFVSLCEGSVYSHQNEIVNGYVTLKGGNRAGIAGRAVLDNGKILDIVEINSLNIRVAKEVIGAAEGIIQALTESDGGIIICGAVCSGKTTILRDAARILSHQSRVCIVDERGELAAIYEGTTPFTFYDDIDILTGFEKSAGILCALRSLSPEVIVCDEIGSAEDISAVEAAAGCGARIVASIHYGENCGDNIRLEKLIRTGVFSHIVYLKGEGKPGAIERVERLS